MSHHDLLTFAEVIRTLQHRFPQWQSPTQFQERVHWLLSLRCLEQSEGRRMYQSTAFGRAIYHQYSGTVADPNEATPDARKVRQDSDTQSTLVRKLEEAALDSDTPRRFEQALAEVFSFLGFKTKLFGDAGHTDILLKAPLGPDSFSVIVDAKARKDGRLHTFEAYTIQEHLEKHEADFAVIVAADFALGKVVRQAEMTKVALMPVRFVRSWVQLHEATPLNLSHYRAMFEFSGVVTEFPSAIIAAADKHQRTVQLIVAIMNLIQEAYAHHVNLAWTTDQLYSTLAVQLRHIRYTQAEVEEAIRFLAYPTVQAVMVNDRGSITLGMGQEMLASTLRTLAQAVERTCP